MLCDKTRRSLRGRSAVTKLHQTVQSAGMHYKHCSSVNFRWRFPVKAFFITKNTQHGYLAGGCAQKMGTNKGARTRRRNRNILMSTNHRRCYIGLNFTGLLQIVAMSQGFFNNYRNTEEKMDTFLQ